MVQFILWLLRGHGKLKEPKWFDMFDVDLDAEGILSEESAPDSHLDGPEGEE